MSSNRSAKLTENPENRDKFPPRVLRLAKRMNLEPHQVKDKLFQLYWGDELRLRAIARKYNISYSSLRDIWKDLDIPCRKGGKPVTDQNRLTIHYPKVAKEWLLEKNGGLKPDQVAYGSDKKYWWGCSVCGNEWKATVGSRTCGGCGCSACAGNVVTDRNRLTAHPCWKTLQHEWDYESNPKPPKAYASGSRARVNWVCPKPDCGYKWLAIVQRRTRAKHPTGCPACAGRVVTDRNRLTVCCPEVAKEWHPTKNKPLEAKDVSIGCDKTFWWYCAVCGREWRARLADRVKPVMTGHGRTYIRARGCRDCALADTLQFHPDYWRPWQDFCETLAKRIYSDMQVLMQYKGIKGINPDIIVKDCTGRVVVIVDAKMSGHATTPLMDDVRKYSPHCPRLEFWCFRNSPRFLDIKTITDIPVKFYLPYQLLARVIDNKMRTMLTEAFQQLQRENQQFIDKFSALQSRNGVTSILDFLDT